MNFENTVARFRKVSEMVDELKEYANALAAERDSLEAGIIATCSKDPSLYNVFKRKTSSAGIVGRNMFTASLYNVFKRKTSSAGIVGRNMFTVTFSEQLERAKDGARLDDQAWLESLALDEPASWVATKKELRKSKVTADFKAGAVSEAELKRFGMRFGRRAHVAVKRIPEDAELNALLEAAEAATAESAE